MTAYDRKYAEELAAAEKRAADMAAIFARLDALEARTDGHGYAIEAWVGVASSTAATVERLESARIAAPVAPESAVTASGVPMEPGNATEAPRPELADAALEYVHGALVEIANALGVRTASDYEEGQDAPNWKLVERILATAAEVAAALRMYRKVQGCTVEGRDVVVEDDSPRFRHVCTSAVNLLACLAQGR